MVAHQVAQGVHFQLKLKVVQVKSTFQVQLIIVKHQVGVIVTVLAQGAKVV